VAGLLCITAPSEEPIDLLEMREFLRVTNHAEDRLIRQLMRDARQEFDGPAAWFGRALVTQTWDLVLDAFPLPNARPECEAANRKAAILLPLPPLQSVTSVKYLDANGVQQTLDPTAYQVDTRSEPGELMPAYGTQWPTARSGAANAVTVRFVAGYGPPPAVPEPIKVWIMRAAAFRYDNRSTTNTLPPSFFWTMANYKATWPL
jgi:uncharacterized phiE125 gp8 family phage protein